MNRDFTVCNKRCTIIAGGAFLIGLYLTSLSSYLLFHSLVEFVSIAIAWSIFVLAWNSRRFITNHYLLFLGVAYLFVGSVDLLHALAYNGMGVFAGDTSNLATQLWLVARFLEAGSLLAAPFFLRRKLNLGVLFAAYSGILAVVLLSIFAFHIFPACYVPGEGLTVFKKVSEYVISGALVASIVFLLRRRDTFDPQVLKLIVASIVLTIFAELAFTFYVSVYGLSNLLGHFFKIVSFFLIYKALVETGLRRPYDLLFRNLKESEVSMRALSSRYEAILSAVPDMIVEVDADKRIKWLNLSAMSFYGPDAIGKDAWSFFVGEQDTYRQVAPLFNGEESVYYVESWQRRMDGEARLLAWWCRVIKDADGNVMGALSTARDITDQRRNEGGRVTTGDG